MKDIDFDELDKAVNRFLGEDMAEKTQAAVAPEKDESTTEYIKPEEDQAKPLARPARELHSRSVATSSQVARPGRFMDIMRPSQIGNPSPAQSIFGGMKPQSQMATPGVNPIKAQADLVENLSDDIHQRRARKSISKGLSEELEVESSVNYEQPVLEAVEITKLPKPTLVPDFDALKAQQILPAEDVPTDDLKAQSTVESKPETLSGDKFVEPFLGASYQDKPNLNDEIITSGAPGLTQIEDEDDMLVYGGTHETVRERISRQAVEQVRHDIPSNISTEEPSSRQTGAVQPAGNAKTDSENNVKNSTTKDDEPEAPLTTPFLPNARVEKRPLGTAPTSYSNSPENTESRLVNGMSLRKVKKSADSKAPVPILNSDEYSSPIVARPKKKSGWTIVLAILGVVIVGALGGLLAWYLLLG